MDYCYWWREQNGDPATHRLLTQVCELHDWASREQRTGAGWRTFVDQLYDLIQDATDVSTDDRRTIWQDSLSIRAARCGARMVYTPHMPVMWLYG